MTIQKHSVFVWRDDRGGGFAAAPVELLDLGRLDPTDELVGLGHSAREAVEAIEGYLDTFARREGWFPEPQLAAGEGEIVTIVVPVRAEYRSAGRVYPAGDPVRLRVPCVVGSTGAGLRLISMPQLGLRVFASEEQPLKSVITHYVQGKLEGSRPSELLPWLGVSAAGLERIAVKVPISKPKPPPVPALPALSAVADALDDRRSRRRFTPAWQREQEAADLARRLSEERASVILVGDPGSGKTTLLADAVRRIPAEGRAARFWLTSGGRLIAGMRYLGQWQERLEEVVAELASVNGVLCVESLVDLVRAGGQSGGDGIAAFLMPYLDAGELRMIAEATPAELDACRRLLPGLVERFQAQKLRELDSERVVSLLSSLAEARAQAGLQVDASVPRVVQRLFARFDPYAAFPGRAARFLGQVVDRAIEARLPAIGKEEAFERFVEHTGLPELFLRDDVPLSAEEIFDGLRAQVIGQDRACRAVSSVVAAFKAGMNDPSRPLSVLLFCGPSGVGKTQLARTLADYCFGHGREKDRLVRLDMSEYATLGAALRLVGAPGGEPGALVRRVREQPFVVVLLDEVEKAAPEVFDVLLGLLDEGRITDAGGRVTSFTSAFVIMTSNIGARARTPAGIGAPPPVAWEREVQSFFRPELFNRIDEVVAFDPLAHDTVLAIVEKELRAVSIREGLARRGLALTWSREVVELLAARGFDERYGARPVQRAIEESVVAPLAKLLLTSPAPGTIHLSSEDGTIRLTR